MVQSNYVEFGVSMNPISLDSPGGISDVAGIKVGHYTDSRRPTGCTVILAESGAVAGVDVRGSAPGTRETDLLNHCPGRRERLWLGDSNRGHAVSGRAGNWV